MTLRLPDPGTFESLLASVAVSVDTLVRLSTSPATEPWWSAGRHRFDGPLRGLPGSFGTCYAAPALVTAFCESVIHENSLFRGGQFLVSLSKLTDRHIVTFRRTQRPLLELADFRGDSLKRLGINGDISTGSDCSVAQRWALAVHEAKPQCDGILCHSRQRTGHVAVALFERSSIQVGAASHSKGSSWPRFATPST